MSDNLLFHNKLSYHRKQLFLSYRKTSVFKKILTSKLIFPEMYHVLFCLLSMEISLRKATVPRSTAN